MIHHPSPDLLPAMITSSGILTIDLHAICANWHFLKNQVAPHVDVAAVVKANAYGLGAVPVVRALRKEGCTTFFFATKEEALASGLNGEHCLKIVLSGVRPGDEPFFVEGQLTPVLYSLADVQRWNAYARNCCKRLPCILKVDTGMTRMGMSIEELEAFCEAHASIHIAPLFLMSHLACADTPSHPANQRQLQLFKQALDIAQVRFPQIKASLANSAGILLGADWHFDLVRPGAALYGINPVSGIPNLLKPVITLSLPVLQIRSLQHDAYVGYSATHFAKAGSRLAVVAGGYADGIHRTLGFKPLAQFNGMAFEAVGRVSMDSCVFDISQCPENRLPQVGDYLEVVNESLSLNFLMERNASLGYEVLNSLGTRFHRIYQE